MSCRTPFSSTASEHLAAGGLAGKHSQLAVSRRPQSGAKLPDGLRPALRRAARSGIRCRFERGNAGAGGVGEGEISAARKGYPLA